MSTRGVLIIHKDKTEKGMAILHDAYPTGAGVDIIDLIETTELTTLYNAMQEEAQSVKKRLAMC